MVKDKNGQDIKFEWIMLLQFALLWGIIYLGITVLNIGWFLVFKADLTLMWLSNITVSLPIAIAVFYNQLISGKEDYNSWPR